jgi:hypothetical protein
MAAAKTIEIVNVTGKRTKGLLATKGAFLKIAKTAISWMR